MSNIVSVTHILCHALHALRHSENTEVFVSDLTEETGYIHELYQHGLEPEIEKANIVFATVSSALMSILKVKIPDGSTRLEVAVALAIAPATAGVICASDHDVDVCRQVIADRPEWLPQLLQDSQMLVHILSICVGYDDWCNEFAAALQHRPIRLDTPFFDNILATGVLPELGNKLEIA